MIVKVSYILCMITSRLFALPRELVYMITKDIIHVVDPFLALHIAHHSKQEKLIKAVQLRIASFKIGTDFPGSIDDERAFMRSLNQFLFVDAYATLTILKGQLAVTKKGNVDTRTVEASVNILIARINSRRFENLPNVGDNLAQESSIGRLRIIRCNLIRMYKNSSLKLRESKFKFPKFNLVAGKILLGKRNNLLVTATIGRLCAISFCYKADRSDITVCSRFIALPDECDDYFKKVIIRSLMELFAKMRGIFAISFQLSWNPFLYDVGLIDISTNYSERKMNVIKIDLDDRENRKRCNKFLELPLLNIVDSTFYRYLEA